MNVNKDGSVFDDWQGNPAYAIGPGPHVMILAVNGYTFRRHAGAVIAHPNDGNIAIIVCNFNSMQTHVIHYSEGVRHSHLDRIPTSPDYLNDIFKPRKR